MEIASYEILIAAANHVGDTQTARVCGEILNEEQTMADWLKETYRP
jgi:ferritin-like metal-binding protein YciE